MKEFIEIPFGAKDSELGGWEYTIPEGYIASIKDGKIIVKKEESENERVRKELIKYIKDQQSTFISAPDCRDKYEEEENNRYNSWIDWLEKQGDIDRHIQEEIEKQTKQQWNAEKQDKQNPTWKKSLATADLENSLCDIQDGYPDTSYEYRILGEAIEFIRCTEPQPHWKPSDEQMIAIQKAMNIVGVLTITGGELNSLYRSLKKLKEESYESTR